MGWLEEIPLSFPFTPLRVDSGPKVKLQVVFAYSDRFADDLQTKHTMLTGFIDRAFERNSLKGEEGVQILLHIRFFFFPVYIFGCALDHFCLIH